MGILVLNDLKYSTNSFDDYERRAIVYVKTVGDEHQIDIYTTDTNKESVENVLLDRKTDKVTSFTITHWTTRERDDLMSKFIDESLKDI